jgi:hypothetical protein
MKSGFLAVFFLGVAVAACSGTGERTGAGGDGGEEPTTSGGNPTSSSSSSSGMGGAGGNGTGGAGGTGGTGGTAPTTSADKLGQICNSITPCAPDYICLALDPTVNSGFCTIKCDSPMDTTTCSAMNGFLGPGAGKCALSAKNAMGTMFTVCGIFCGAQFNLPDPCPTGLTCQDKFTATGAPGTDGKNDLCVP